MTYIKPMKSETGVIYTKVVYFAKYHPLFS